MKSTFLLLITCVTSLIGYAQDSRFSFKESYELSSPSQLAISSSDGNIDVVAIEAQKTDIFYIVKKNNKILNVSRQELDKEIDLTVEQSGNSLTIVVKYKSDFHIMDWKDKMIINFRVQTPSATACDLRTSDGNVSITGLKKDQKLRTSDGDVNIKEIKGAVVASTSDGNVNVSSVEGPIEVKTSDGNINVSDIRGNTSAGTSDGNIVVRKISGDTHVKTSDGDIDFTDLSGSLTASTSDGNVKGNLLKLTKELDVRTSDGNITVAIPANMGLDLDIKGESLDIPLNNFSGHSDEKRIQGKSNGGGVAVKISTSGNVRLDYR